MANALARKKSLKDINASRSSLSRVSNIAQGNRLRQDMTIDGAILFSGASCWHRKTTLAMFRSNPKSEAVMSIKVNLVLFVMLMLGISALAQQAEEIPDGPVPSAIVNSKTVFVSNGGEQSNYRMAVSDHFYDGGPNRVYNQFYQAMKTWGRYTLVSSPGEADLVFEISFDNRNEGLSQIKLKILDSKTHFTLWTITKYAESAGMAKNREKNLNNAVTALMNELKVLASPPSAAQK
jgi:hypothetical protein